LHTDQSNDINTEWLLVDPATVFNLDIGGNHVSGGYILNDAGNISSYGDLTYDNQSKSFSLDTTSLVGLDVSSGETTVELITKARMPGNFDGTLGDPNGNEVVDGVDVDLLDAKIYASYTPVDVFDIYDLNLDGVVNGGVGGDMQILVETVLLSKLGDANLDGFIGNDDLDAVLNNWNLTNTGYRNGDLDGDGFTGLSDLDMVMNNWNWGTPPAAVGASIPEPATLSLIGLGLFASAGRRR